MASCARQSANQEIERKNNSAHRFTFDDLNIRTKDKRTVVFEPNAVQSQYLDNVLPQWRTGEYSMRGVREIILKSRQFGFSTLILALFFLDTINTPNTQTVVIAHDSDSTERLFQMVQRFYQHLPEALRPRTKYANRREFLWPDIDSYFFVGTAGSGEFGRGGTINNVHASEVAFWPNGEDIMAGLMQAVPQDGNVFQESTANGLGNYYYEEYERAGAGQSALTSRFFPWFAHPEYSNGELPFDFAISDDEMKLKELYGLSDGQLLWRRLKLREPGMAKKFVQEYPANPLEAFIASGNPYFDNDKLNERAAVLKGPDYAPLPKDRVLEVIPTRFARLRAAANNGELKLWDVPESDKNYVVGADTAEGITDHGDHDYDSADVFETDEWTQSAHLHGRWDTREYGLILAELGEWYNTALLGVERNNHGHAVINAIRYEANYPDANDDKNGLYLHQEYDEHKKPTQKRAGWPQTARNKAFGLDTLATCVLEEEIWIRSRDSIGEMMKFVKKAGGKAGGEGRAHDDRVISLMIAAVLLKLRPRDNWRGTLDFLQSRLKGNTSTRT